MGDQASFSNIVLSRQRENGGRIQCECTCTPHPSSMMQNAHCHLILLRNPPSRLSTVLSKDPSFRCPIIATISNLPKQPQTSAASLRCPNPRSQNRPWWRLLLLQQPLLLRFRSLNNMRRPLALRPAVKFPPSPSKVRTQKPLVPIHISPTYPHTGFPPPQGPPPYVATSRDAPVPDGAPAPAYVSLPFPQPLPFPP